MAQKLFAIVKFKRSEGKYTYATEVEGLQPEDKVWVETRNGLQKARFVTYVPEEYLTVYPVAKLTGRRVDEVEEVQTGNKQRSQIEITRDTDRLYKLLDEARPTALTSAQIAEKMGWDVKSATSHIKTSMKRRSSIISYDHNLYTVRRSEQDKYKFASEVK